jgi:ribonuclease HII
VVASALAFNSKNLPPRKFIKELNDSKKLTEKKREQLFQQLIGMSL